MGCEWDTRHNQHGVVFRLTVPGTSNADFWLCRRAVIYSILYAMQCSIKLQKGIIQVVMQYAAESY